MFDGIDLAAAAARLRRNQPYLGRAEGLTTRLRERFGPDEYLGLGLEVLQRFPRGVPSGPLDPGAGGRTNSRAP